MNPEFPPPVNTAGEGIAQLDEIAAAQKLALTPCTRCRKRFGIIAAPEGALLCELCVVPHARAIRRAAKFERRRQARMFPRKMSVPKGKR